jgi:hypothetical protein
MTADLNRLMDNLRIRLPGATDEALKLEYFSAMDQFFGATNIWTEDIDFAVTTDNKTYYVTPTGVANILRLMGVVNSDGTTVAALMKTPGEITLVNYPNQADTYTLQLALSVKDPVTRDGYPEYPDWILEKYGVDIIDGVPYTNERMAIYHMKRFQNTMAMAKVEAQHRNVYRGQSWRFPQTFARRRAW